MLSTYEHYVQEGLMGNITLKGSAITRWQAQRQLKSSISLHDDHLLEALLRVHGSGCQSVRLNKNGDTAFMLAVRSQYKSGFQLLLQFNAANPNLTNERGSSALDVALLASTVPDNVMDDYLILLSRITREVSVDVLMSVLDPEWQDLKRVVKTASLVARHSEQYEVRAKLMFALVKYYPALIPPMLTDHGVDPTGITDPRMDPRQLWLEVIKLHYFKQPILQIIPKDLVLLLIRAANGDEAVDNLVELVMNSLQIAGAKQTPAERQFHYEALTELAVGGCRFSPDAVDIISSHIPEVLDWYMATFRGAPALMSIAREAIRGVMACNVIYGSKHLPLPPALQRYLCLE